MMELTRTEIAKLKFNRTNTRSELRHPLTPSFYNAHLNSAPDTNEIDYYIKYSDDFINAVKSYKPKPQQRGIVTCGGGKVYFTCAYIMIRALRDLGCTLPIELWYLGSREMTSTMKTLVEKYGVVCRDAYALRKEVPARILNGWELKPYAIMNSDFNEVIFIDADNLPIVNPEAHFMNKKYQDTGSLFWPDQGILDQNRPIWKVCKTQYVKEPEFETGAMLIDKARCWKELNLTMHFNENSDYYYRYMHGDKETFHMAWHRLGTPFGMISHGLKRIDINGNWVTFCQHDDTGGRVFQHRNTLKWSFDGHNQRIPGFVDEDRCFKYLSDLRQIWSGVTFIESEQSDAVRKLTDRLIKSLNHNIHYVYPSGQHFSFIAFTNAGKVFDLGGFTANYVIEDDGISTTIRLLDGWHRTIAIFRPEGDRFIARDYRNEVKSTLTIS